MLTANASTVAATPIPDSLPWPEKVPEFSQLRGRDKWMFEQLATITQPNGFDRQTGKPVVRTTDVVAAPFPDFRAVVRLPKTTAFADVISMARAVAVDGDRDSKYGNAQAVMQSEAGNWYITMAGVPESDDHIEPLPVTWAEDASVEAMQSDLVAMVGSHNWVNFSQNEL